MKHGFLLGIILLFSLNCSYSQVIPLAKVKFNRVQGWEVVGEEMFGKMTKEVLATTEVEVFELGLYSYLTIESTLMGGMAEMSILSARDLGKVGNYESYMIDCRDIGADSRSSYLVEYNQDKILVSITYIAEGDLQGSFIKYLN